MVGGVASYASSRSAKGDAEDAAKLDLEARKELLQMERDFALEDRKFFQDSVGAWGKYADPSLMPATFGENATPSTSPRVAPFQRPQGGGGAPFTFASKFPEYDFYKRPELPYGQG